MSRATTLTQSEIDEILSFHCISNFPAPFLSLSLLSTSLSNVSKVEKIEVPRAYIKKKRGKKERYIYLYTGKTFITWQSLSSPSLDFPFDSVVTP
jgi:hypothetical protein